MATTEVGYLLLTGLDYAAPDGSPTRAEADDVVLDLPESSVPWLLEQGLIVEFDPEAPAPAAPAPATEPAAAPEAATQPQTPVPPADPPSAPSTAPEGPTAPLSTEKVN